MLNVIYISMYQKLAKAQCLLTRKLKVKINATVRKKDSNLIFNIFLWFIQGISCTVWMGWWHQGQLLPLLSNISDWEIRSSSQLFLLPTVCPSWHHDIWLATVTSSIRITNPNCGSPWCPVCCHLFPKVFIYYFILFWSSRWLLLTHHFPDFSCWSTVTDKIIHHLWRDWESLWTLELSSF